MLPSSRYWVKNENKQNDWMVNLHFTPKKYISAMAAAKTFIKDSTCAREFALHCDCIMLYYTLLRFYHGILQ